jgi:hypothetical protein
VEGEAEPFDGAPEMLSAERSAPPPRARTAAPPRQTPRQPPKPYSAYAEEYAYVVRDLRQIGYVVGGILLFLIVLYFVLPR